MEKREDDIEIVDAPKYMDMWRKYLARQRVPVDVGCTNLSESGLRAVAKEFGATVTRIGPNFYRISR